LHSNSEAEEIETGLVKPVEAWSPGAMTLPGRYYVDPGLFRAEQERIFLRHWLCPGRKAQIPAAGDFFLREADTESVIVVRGEDGAVRAFHNLCRHRGTRICGDAAGRFSGAIRCPYHAWTYGVDGRLLAASSMAGVNGFDRADYPLLPVAVAEWEGFALLSLAERPEPFDQPGFDPQNAVGFWDRTNREDWDICERSQLGVASRAYRPGPYSPREGISAAFDRCYLQELAE